MTISHRELMQLARLPKQFPIIGAYLRGASVDVTFDPGGGIRTRTHLIVDSREFPFVFIAVEGSPGRPADRQFSAPTGIYHTLDWELADPDDEVSIMGLIAGKREEDAAAAVSAQAEMDRRAAAHAEAERAAAALRTAEHMAEARKRLRAGHDDHAAPSDWDRFLQDLSLLVASIEREAD